MQERHQKLQRLGISSIALTNEEEEDVIDFKLVDELAAGKYQAVFMTPELIDVNKRVKDLWTMPMWVKRLMAVVLDEAHCVCVWGADFRPAYNRLSHLRPKVPPEVAFIAVSATLPPTILSELKQVMGFHKDVPEINVGNDRPDVRLEVRYCSTSSFRCLDFLLDMEKAIVYLDAQKDVVDATKYLRALAANAEKVVDNNGDTFTAAADNGPPKVNKTACSIYNNGDPFAAASNGYWTPSVNEDAWAVDADGDRWSPDAKGDPLDAEPQIVETKKWGKIAYYHALMSDLYKRQCMVAFRRGEIRILISTEAAGMGCDISDVVRVVQVGRPKSISSLVQRLGRAARDPTMQGFGIICVSPPNSATKYMEEHITDYISTTGCRRQILNKIFGNENQPNENCCDNCHPHYGPQLRSLKSKLTDGKPTIQYPTRTVAQKEAAKEAILRWRKAAYERDARPRSDYYEEDFIMSDELVKELSDKFGKIQSVNDIRANIAWSGWNEQQKKDLAGILIALNKKFDSGDSTCAQEPHQAIQVGNNLAVGGSHQVPALQRPSAQPQRPTSRRPGTFMNFTPDTFLEEEQRKLKKKK
jgi:hypothetical protein